MSLGHAVHSKPWWRSWALECAWLPCAATRQVRFAIEHVGDVRLDQVWSMTSRTLGRGRSPLSPLCLCIQCCHCSALSTKQLLIEIIPTITRWLYSQIYLSPAKVLLPSWPPCCCKSVSPVPQQLASASHQSRSHHSATKGWWLNEISM